MPELRSLIREILTEEIGRLQPGAPVAHPQITEEQVQIRTNADLASFVARLMRAAQDGRLRADIASGQHVFRLANDAGVAQQVMAHQPLAPSPAAPSVVSFERGLFGERQVASLPAGTRQINVGKAVRFTPLAKDELRRRGITIERSVS